MEIIIIIIITTIIITCNIIHVPSRNILLLSHGSTSQSDSSTTVLQLSSPLLSSPLLSTQYQTASSPLHVTSSPTTCDTTVTFTSHTSCSSVTTTSHFAVISLFIGKFRLVASETSVGRHVPSLCQRLMSLCVMMWSSYTGWNSTDHTVHTACVGF